ncbi:hypothetical protein INP83_05480 [Mucilaginibacter sp. 21P]|uniref:hypothetical protein n=1 Tax=Mucilaginibacter sp. 21P TaxID=2778902 RepID=UPI001C57FE0B|nr:hypothetical protein [Mucilaginibacter sp. 21P]QXV66536.1 hypothetical protein INP83_05480 [Mucilaginibacter sp. 21P]
MAIDINEFIKLFAFAPANFIEESFKEVRIRFTANELVQISNEIGQTDSISFLNDRDLLKISVFVGDDDPIDYYSPGSTVNFFREVFNRLEIREDDEKIEIHFDIIKKTVYGILSIYFPDKFIEYVSDLELTEVLHGLHNEFQQEQKLILQPLTGKLTFRTATIASDINKVDSRFMSYEMRESRVASLNSIGNFNLTNSFKFIPDDFHILECSNQQLKILFNKICAIYSTAYLFDIIAVSKSIIDYKLNGYKTIIGQLDFRILRERHLAEYFRIYDWTFKGEI